MGQWFRDKKVYADLGAGTCSSGSGGGVGEGISPNTSTFFNNFHMVCFMRGEGFEDLTMAYPLKSFPPLKPLLFF